MDPLCDSPLRILDAGGALGLVLDRVDEDDALFAALACTTFRDALFAQPRHAVRPADKLHAGKRLVTNVAGVAPRTAGVAGAGVGEHLGPGYLQKLGVCRCAGRAPVGAHERLRVGCGDVH